MTNVQVKCDEAGCGWILGIEAEQVRDWHNKTCPQCGKGIIVNDAEIILHAVAGALEAISATVGGDKKTMHLDTAKLRKGRG